MRVPFIGDAHITIIGKPRKRLGEGQALSISIVFGDMCGENAHFLQRMRRKMLPLPDFRPEIPKNFRKSAYLRQKRYFFDGMSMRVPFIGDAHIA